MKIALREIAAVIRSKNSGPYELTFDVMLKDDETFEKLRQSGTFTPELIAKLYRIPVSDVLSIVWFPNARAVKATIVRPLPSGDLGERDVVPVKPGIALQKFGNDHFSLLCRALRGYL